MSHAYVIPVRTDCPGAGLQVLDLVPNTSQKNSIYDGPGQTFYLHGADCPYTTVVNGDAYVSGSRMTVLDTTADDATVQDTTGGGNNVRATAHAQFGLAAYLRERVQPGGLGLATADRMAPSDAQTLAVAIMSRVWNGLDIALADINTVLCTGAFGGTASTDLTGTGTSRSFGTVEDILRILSGEVYETPRYTIITNIVGGPAYQFQTLAQRNVFVAAQVTATTGKTFVSTGHFLTRSEAGFVDIAQIALTGEVLASAGAGYLSKGKGACTFKNPSFAYSLAEATSMGKHPAVRWDGVLVPTTGYTAHLCRTYSNLGVAL